MPRYHATASGPVQFTAQEEIDRDAEEAAWVSSAGSALDVASANKCAEINAERDRRFYSDISATFPAGTKSVQMRDERDRANFANVVQGAMALVIAGAPTASVQFITGDNATQTLQAQQMIPIGLAVMAAKQAIIQTARTKKDEVLALTTSEAIAAYDLMAGWPAP